jgi:hypothetical protein
MIEVLSISRTSLESRHISITVLRAASHSWRSASKGVGVEGGSDVFMFPSVLCSHVSELPVHSSSFFPWIAIRLGRGKVHETCGEHRAGIRLRNRMRVSGGLLMSFTCRSCFSRTVVFNSKVPQRASTIIFSVQASKVAQQTYLASWLADYLWSTVLQLTEWQLLEILLCVWYLSPIQADPDGNVMP